MRPEILIISSLSHYNLNLKDKSKDYYYLATQQELHQQLQSYVNKMVYITDTPKPVKNIPRCLSHESHESCNQINRSSNVVYEKLIKIDPYPWFCDKSCTAVKDGYIVYRDASHITRAAAKSATDELEKALIQKQVFN